MAKIVISHRRRTRNGQRRGRAALLATMALVAAALANVTAYAPPALANAGCGHNQPILPSGSSDGTYNFVGGTWTRSDNDVEGVRAPILVRLDGSLCTNTTLNDFATAWIGIQAQKSAFIVQIGYDRHWNADGSPEHCRFWANNTGAPHYYDCTDSDATYVFFLVEQHKDSNGQYYYDIEDCGTEGDFNNCTIKDGTQPIFRYPQGAVFSETNYGDPQDGCPTQMLGDDTNPVLYGNSNWGLRGEVTGSWGPRGWVVDAPAGCTGDYKGGTTSYGLETWDARNTS